MELVALLFFGFISGIRHALDADHLAAVSTMASRAKRMATAATAGAWWGLGHTTTLMTAGSVVLIFGLAIPERLSVSLEGLVGVMLIFLGLVNFRLAYVDRVHLHRHVHDDHQHFHLHYHNDGNRPHEHRHTHEPKAARSYTIGLVHGLAGSGALTLVILSTFTSAFWGIIYIALFGLGSILGMSVFGGLLTLPVALGGRRWHYLPRLLTIASAVFSLLIGTSFLLGLIF